MLREVPTFTQGHTASRWQSCDSNPGLANSKTPRQTWLHVRTSLPLAPTPPPVVFCGLQVPGA